MKILVRLRFQKPPSAHWHLSVKIENDCSSVVVKELFVTWRNSKLAPRPRHTLAVIHSLVDIAKHALKTQQG